MSDASDSLYDPSFFAVHKGFGMVLGLTSQETEGHGSEMGANELKWVIYSYLTIHLLECTYKKSIFEYMTIHSFRVSIMLNHIHSLVHIQHPNLGLESSSFQAFY